MTSNEQLVNEETLENGLIIRFYVLNEDTSIKEHFRDCYTAKELTEISKKINNGSMVWFCAKVTAFIKIPNIDYGNGTQKVIGEIEISSDYLGGCLYDNYNDFIDNDGYYGDMKDEVISDSKKILEHIRNLTI